MNKTPMVTAGQIRAALAGVPDDMGVQVCIDSPRDGDTSYAYTIPVCTDQRADFVDDPYYALTFIGESDMVNNE